MKKSALALAIGASIATQAAFSQEQSWAIEEVIVTSQKRMQTLQDIPIAVTAFSGDFIADAHITDVKQLTTMTPGVTGDSDDSFLDTLNIRGIVTNDFGVGAEPSIGLYQDGVYLGRTGGAVTSFYDLEMIEVVKGPQGTLFGRNSSAGAISIATKKPHEELEGSFNVGSAEDGYLTYTGVLNSPLSDTTAMRLAIFHEEQDGWIKNIENGKEYGGYNTDAARLSFAYLGEALIATLAFEYEDHESDGTIYNVFNKGSDPQLEGWERPSRKYGDVAISDTAKPEDEGEVWGVTLTLEYDISDEYSLTSTSAVRGHNYYYLEDFDGSAFDIDHYFQDQEQDYYSQEFRINYEGEGDIVWFAGVSAYKEDLDVASGDSYDEDTQCSFSAAAYYAAYYNIGYVLDQFDYVSGCVDYAFYNYDTSSYQYGVAGNGYVTESRKIDAEYDGWGVYGDITWSATEDLEITVGARYTEDNREVGLWVLEDTQLANPSIFNGAAYTDGYVYQDESWDNFSPRVAVNYYVNYDISVYANISQGYKAGGYNTNSLSFKENNGAYWANEILNGRSGDATTDALIETFDQEEVTNFEIGIKSKWWDNRIEAKASIFQYNFDDYQVNFFDEDIVATRVVNAGDAEGRGLEADLRILPTANIDIYLGVAFLDTELTDVAESQICDTNCKGNTLPGTIETSYALVGTYIVPFAESELRLTLENFYQDDYSVDFDDRKEIRGDDYSKFNFRMIFAHDNGWTVEGYVENLTDEEYYKGASYDSFSIGSHQFSPARPRTVGMNIGYDF